MYQFEVMNNIFDAMEEWIVHFGSRLSYMATSVTQMHAIKDKLGMCILICISLLICIVSITSKETMELKAPHKDMVTLMMTREYYIYSSSYVLNGFWR